MVAEVAGGIGGQRIAAVHGIQHLSLLRHTIAARIEHLIAHIVRDASAIIGIAAHMGAGHQLARLLVADVPAGVVVGGVVVVIDRVGLYSLVVASQPGIPGQVVKHLVGTFKVL